MGDRLSHHACFTRRSRNAGRIRRPLAALRALALCVVLAAPTTMHPAGAAEWRTNDPARPQPPTLLPRQAVLDLRPPADAIVLFDGSGLDAWIVPPDSGWASRGGSLLPGGRVFNKLLSRESFGDLQLHLEFRTPTPPSGEGQHRGNSGVFLMGVYEIQILDSFNNPTYADGTLGAVYGQTPPLVLAPRPPGVWQSFDIYFQAPRIADGAVVEPPYVTVVLNGIVVQQHQRIFGDTSSKPEPAAYHTVASTGPIGLQDHGSADCRVAFRNIWVRALGNHAGGR